MIELVSICNSIIPTVIFTRYLYVVDDVFYSLYNCILFPEQHTIDEILFWSYELYFSGFDNELFSFIDLHVVNNSIFSKHIKLIYSPERSIKEETRERKLNMFDSSLSVANIIGNIFVIIKQHKQNNDSLLLINFSDSDIQTYATIEVNSNIHSYQVMRHACKYNSLKIDKFIGEGHYDRNSLKIMFREKWLYYAHFTPIWRERIHKYDGIANNEEIIFNDEKKEDEFYNQFNYEPDEQSIEIFNKCIGNNNDVN